MTYKHDLPPPSETGILDRVSQVKNFQQRTEQRIEQLFERWDEWLEPSEEWRRSLRSEIREEPFTAANCAVLLWILGMVAVIFLGLYRMLFSPVSEAVFLNVRHMI